MIELFVATLATWEIIEIWHHSLLFAASPKCGDSVLNVQHLLRHGWFVKINDYSVTIETLKTGEHESYPLEQIVVCLGMDILKERALEKQRCDENR